ncbi:hypothetical protein Tco_0033161 [Tanacetum coccineum]
MSMKEGMIANGDHVDFINGSELFMQTDSESSKQPSQDAVSKESNHIDIRTKVGTLAQCNFLKKLCLLWFIQEVATKKQKYVRHYVQNPESPYGSVASGSVGAGLDTSTVRLLSADQDLRNVGVFNDACSLGSSGVPLFCAMTDMIVFSANREVWKHKVRKMLTVLFSPLIRTSTYFSFLLSFFWRVHLNTGESSSAGGGKGKGLLAVDYMTGRAAAPKNYGSAHYPAESLGAAIGNQPSCALGNFFVAQGTQLQLAGFGYEEEEDVG